MEFFHRKTNHQFLPEIFKQKLWLKVEKIQENGIFSERVFRCLVIFSVGRILDLQIWGRIFLDFNEVLLRLRIPVTSDWLGFDPCQNNKNPLCLLLLWPKIHKVLSAWFEFTCFDPNWYSRICPSSLLILGSIGKDKPRVLGSQQGRIFRINHRQYKWTTMSLCSEETIFVVGDGRDKNSYALKKGDDDDLQLIRQNTIVHHIESLSPQEGGCWVAFHQAPKTHEIRQIGEEWPLSNNSNNHQHLGCFLLRQTSQTSGEKMPICPYLPSPSGIHHLPSSPFSKT